MTILRSLGIKGLGSLLVFVEPILRYIVEHEEAQTGGVFCIADRKSGVPILTYTYGNLTDVKRSKYMTYAIEKAQRLAGNPNHYSSSESRDPEKHRYSGAIRGRTYIYSFSGFKEVQDEAAMLFLEFHADVFGLGGEYPEFTKCCDQNTYFPKLLRGMNRCRL